MWVCRPTPARSRPHCLGRMMLNPYQNPSLDSRERLMSSSFPSRVRSSFLQARVVVRDALRAFKLVKSYSVPFVGRVCEQFRLCKFVKRDQPLLTFGCAIVCRKNPPF